MASGFNDASNAMARVEVVPWSMAMSAAGKTPPERDSRDQTKPVGLVHQHQLGHGAVGIFVEVADQIAG